jgi:L-malate glycosyltransferase
MKVLHVSTPSTWRGGEQQVAYLVKALSESGLEQGILCPRDAALSARPELKGQTIYHFHNKGPIGIQLARRIAAVVRDGGFHLVHTHDSHAHTAAVLAASLFGMRQPLIVSRRVDFPVTKSPLSYWKYNHSCIARILCVSEEIRTVTAPAIRNKGLIKVIRSGVDIERYQDVDGRAVLRRELGLDPTTHLVGNLSALADHKDYPTWLKAAACLKKARPDVHFIIAGTGPEEQRISKLVHKLGLQDCVHLLGFRTDVPEVMTALDVFMISSKTEGLGTIVIEALAAGIPIVATRAGGIPELIVDGECGLLVDTGDSDALCAAVCRIFDEPGLAGRLRAAGRERARRFSFRATAEQTLKVYIEVTGS